MLGDIGGGGAMKKVTNRDIRVRGGLTFDIFPETSFLNGALVASLLYQISVVAIFQERNFRFWER